MAEKIGFLSSDLNGNGKTGWGERLLSLDPGIRAGMGLYRMFKGADQPKNAFWEHADPSRGIPRQNFTTTQNPWQVNDLNNQIGQFPNMGKVPPMQFPTSQPQYGQLAKGFMPQQPIQDLNHGPIGALPGLSRGYQDQGFNYNSAPAMGKADYNRLALQSEAAGMVNNPMNRQIGYTSIAQRFNPTAGHDRFVDNMNKAKFRDDINVQGAYEDDLYQKEMARKLSMLSR